MTLGSHQQTVGKSQTHLTPPHIINALGPFDLDPCAAIGMPWRTAERMLTIEDDGLSAEWDGRVWLNPPFDRYQVGLWIEKLARHADGICLVHARTETEWFRPIWQKASGLLFLFDRLHFHKIDGSRHKANSGAPVVLASFGYHCRKRLVECDLEGWFVQPCGRAGARS